MGINPVTETEFDQGTFRDLREARSKSSPANHQESVPKDQLLISNPRFGQNQSTRPPAIKQQTDLENSWSGLGAKVINTQNLSADKGQDIGRDNLELKTHALDGQLDNKENTFISFTDKSGLKHEAFRSKNVLGVYYGFRKSGDKDWQGLKTAPIDSVELEKALEKAHQQKLKNIENSGSYENYQRQQKALAEINDLNELYPSEQTRNSLDSSRRIALEEIKSGSKDFDLIKQDHPEIAADLLMNRFEKLSQIMDPSQLKDIKTNFENELTKFGAKNSEYGYDFSDVKDKDSLSSIFNKANQAIDTTINDLRNAAQRLNAKEQAEYDQVMVDAEAAIKALLVKQPASPELQKLQDYYKELSRPLDPKQGKYSLNQLKAFKTHLSNLDLANKVPEWNTSTKVFAINENDKLIAALKNMPENSRLHVKRPDANTFNFYTKIDGDIYRDGGNKIAIKINPTNLTDISSKNKYIIEQEEEKFKSLKIEEKAYGLFMAESLDDKKTKAFEEVMDSQGTPSYKEVRLQKLAGIDAYSVNYNDRQYHYSFVNSDKSSPWRIEFAENQGAKTIAGLTDDSNNSRMSAEFNGLRFYFSLNGKLIGLATNQDRQSQLSYSQEELNEALRLVFGK